MTHDEALAALCRQGRGRVLTWQVTLWCLLAVSFGLQAWDRLGADRSDGLGWSMVVLALGNAGIVLSQLPAPCAAEPAPGGRRGVGAVRGV